MNSMKDAFKNKRIYIISAIALVIPVVVMTVWYLIAAYASDDAAIPQLEMIVWAFGILYVLIGFVSGNQTIYHWRKKEAAYDDKPPYELRVEAWTKRLSFFIPALILILTGAAFDIVAATTGFYPISGYPFTGRIIVK